MDSVSQGPPESYIHTSGFLDMPCDKYELDPSNVYNSSSSEPVRLSLLLVFYSYFDYSLEKTIFWTYLLTPGDFLNKSIHYSKSTPTMVSIQLHLKVIWKKEFIKRSLLTKKSLLSLARVPQPAELVDPNSLSRSSC